MSHLTESLGILTSGIKGIESQSNGNKLQFTEHQEKIESSDQPKWRMESCKVNLAWLELKAASFPARPMWADGPRAVMNSEIK